MSLNPNQSIFSMCGFNPYMPSGLFYLNSLDRFISYIGGVWLVFNITMFSGVSELNATSVDPYQTPRSVASDLGLHCFPVSLGLYGLYVDDS